MEATREATEAACAVLVVELAKVLVRAQDAYSVAAVGSEDARRARELVAAAERAAEAAAAVARGAAGWAVVWTEVHSLAV